MVLLPDVRPVDDSPATPVMTTFRKHTALLLRAWQIFTLVFAWNYFAFRVELFDDEYEQNHPAPTPASEGPAFSLPSLTWETFDKDNAPKAVRVEPVITLTLLAGTPDEQFHFRVIPRHYQLIRDKSPPSS